MPVEVRVPTILRTYTAGEKVVSADGASLHAVVLGPRQPATPASPGGSSTTAACKRFVNVYLNDEDVRFLDGLQTPVADADSITILPAVAGG